MAFLGKITHRLSNLHRLRQNLPIVAYQAVSDGYLVTLANHIQVKVANGDMHFRLATGGHHVGTYHAEYDLMGRRQYQEAWINVDH